MDIVYIIARTVVSVKVEVFGIYFANHSLSLSLSKLSLILCIIYTLLFICKKGEEKKEKIYIEGKLFIYNTS